MHVRPLQLELIPGPRAMTFDVYAARWLERYLTEGGNDGQGGRAGQSYRSILDAHLLPWLDGRELASITRQEYRAWLGKLKMRLTRRDRRIAPRTVLNINRCLMAVFNDAVEDELLDSSPIKPARNDLPKARDADPAWRARARFTRAELVRLFFARDVIPLHWSVTFATAYWLAGRIGEVSALTWGCWDSVYDDELGRLLIAHGYSTADQATRGPKTGLGREIPVHPMLARLLREWHARGYRARFGEPPAPGALIVPGSIDAEGQLRPLRNDRAGEWLEKACARLGIARRTPHNFRASLITIAQADGVPGEMVAGLTHPSARDVFGGYSRFSWKEQCDGIARVMREFGEGP